MEIKKILPLFLLIFILVVNIDVGEARLGNFVRGECVEIKTILNTSAVNISSIGYVNGSIAVSNQPMTQNGKSFNYTFCETQDPGVYIYDYFDSEGNVYVNDFLITEIGDEIETADSLIYIVVLISVTLIFTLFLIIALNTPYENVGVQRENGDIEITKITKSKYVKIIAAWISYGFFLWIMAIISGLSNNYIWAESLKDLAQNLYTFVYVLGFGVSVFIMALLFYNLWVDIIMSKSIRKYGKAWINGGPR